MSIPWRSFFLAFICSLAAISSPVLAQAERRVALVIGNSSYREAPLKNPANDAKAMAATLQKQGFKVILRQNASKSEMENAVAEFGEQLSQDSVGLFFFAGHGMQVNGRNYLIPTDAKITSEQRVRLETLDVDIVLDQMQAARARVSMVILDACRNNPFERRFRSFGGGLAQINAPEGTIIAYATAPGKVASDGDGANGLYTTELLRALARPGMRVEDVFKQVRVQVSRASGGNQVPWEASSLVGDFYFNNAPAATAAAAGPAQAMDRELVFWNSVKDSSNAAELDAYLAAYPNGTFAGLARARKAALEPRVPSPSAAAAAAGARPAVQPAAPRTGDVLFEGRRDSQLAALPPSGDKFDGRWSGEYGCSAFFGNPEFRQWRDFIVHKRELRITVGEKDKPGYVTITGKVSESGAVTAEGYGVAEGRTYRINFWGTIEDGRLTANGSHGNRSCWLALTKVSNG
jgi:hypothetical protein